MVSESDFPASPRTLGKKLRRTIWLGTPWLSFSLFINSLVALAICLLMANYQIGFSSLSSVLGDSVTVDSTIEKIGPEEMPSGGFAEVAQAKVQVNGVVLTAKGYGPSTARVKVGDPVTIVIPKRNPYNARLEGFERYPMALSTLVLLAFLFAFPAFLGLLLSLRSSARREKLLREGQEVASKATGQYPLPRPFKDLKLIRYQYEFDQKIKQFWSIHSTAIEKPTVLAHTKGAAIRQSLLPQFQWEQNELGEERSLGQQLLAFNSVLLFVQALLFGLFLFT